MKPTTLTKLTRGILIAAALCVATLTANAGTAIYWKGGSGTDAEPADVYTRDNWTASDTYSGNSISQNPTGQHNFNFATNSFLNQACCYLTNSRPNAASANVCEILYFRQILSCNDEDSRNVGRLECILLR